LKPTEILRVLNARGARLRVDGDRLVVKGPRGVVDAALATAIRARKDELIALLVGRGSGLPPVKPRDPNAPVVLHPTQRRFLQLMRLTSDPGVFAGPGAWRIRGKLDVAAFEHAIQRLVDRHEVLRTRFLPDGNDSVAEVVEDVVVDVGHDDLSTVSEPDREDRLRSLLEEWGYREIDVADPPAVRVRLVRLEPDHHVFLFVGHSVVWDGWSFDIMLDEVRAHYLERLGLGPELPPPPLHFADFAAWHREVLDSGILAADEEYWRRKLAPPLPSLAIPTDHPRRGPTSSAGNRELLRVERGVLDAAREVARECGATPYMVALAALGLVLSKYGGIDDVMVASPLQGREDPRVERVIGTFVNTLFFRTRVDPSADFRTLLERVQATSVEAVEHQLVPSDRVVELMQQQDITRSPYECVFIFQQTRSRPTEWGPLEVTQVSFGADRVGVDLAVWMREFDDFMNGGIDFRTELFEPETIRRMRGHLLRAIELLTAHPDVPVGEHDLRTEDEVAWHDDLEREYGARVLGSAGRPTPTSVWGTCHLVHADGRLEPTDRRARWTSSGELAFDEPSTGGIDPGTTRVSEALSEHPDILEAAAVRHLTPDGEERIVGYVVWADDDPPLVSEIRQLLRAMLPEELVPGMILELDSLPRGADGDLAAAALPNPFGGPASETQREPQTDTEVTIAEIWAQLLGLDAVHVGDNFFELGGHSLLAVEAVALLEDRLGTRVDARSTFFLSLGQIARRIDSEVADGR